jgi:hypothetical protein
MAGCKRWLSNGLSVLELWDLAFSNHMLSKKQIIELLRDDSDFANRMVSDPSVAASLDDQKFLGDVSYAAHKFLLLAASYFQLPVPELFYDRLERVLRSFDDPNLRVDNLIADLRTLVGKGGS